MTVPSSTTTIWRLRLDVAWTHIIRWMVDPTGRRQLNPEIHLYLADRYARLAQCYDRLGNREKTARFKEKAAHHFHLGGGNRPRPAAAMRASLPQSSTFTEAIGQPFEADEGPDDAA
ncbi:MAG TPA: hypothetical protein VFA47_04400 [Candidatus Manganitrophaceae bacterium]|nr:hypothetical protein [Candidatus Manganitrophaceae bacterium]